MPIRMSTISETRRTTTSIWFPRLSVERERLWLVGELAPEALADANAGIEADADDRGADAPVHVSLGNLDRSHRLQRIHGSLPHGPGPYHAPPPTLVVHV